MKIFKTILYLLLLFSIAGYTQGRISVESKVDKAKILVGDVIQYSVIITHDKEVTLLTSPLAVNLGMFEIQDYNVHDAVKTDSGWVREQIDYDISTFDTGEYQIPAVEYRYTVGDDTTSYALETEPIDIMVESLNPDQAGDIRDIKAPMQPPANYTMWYLIGGGVLLAVIAGYLIFYIIRKRRTGESILPKRQTPPRPAHVVALEELDELAQSDLLDKGEVKAHYSRLSDIIRIYIEGRYFIDAMEMTSEEIYDNLYQRKIAPDHLSDLRQILSLSDFVKFAKYVPTRTENETSINLAVNFVNNTKLIFSRQPEAASANEDEQREADPSEDESYTGESDIVEEREEKE
ncbi:hypothetical protein GF407_06545 [candidate division KSB1 bacterium]|nr:hypothetical protein [candidate division KSB1 bacterium]